MLGCTWLCDQSSDIFGLAAGQRSGPRLQLLGVFIFPAPTLMLHTRALSASGRVLPAANNSPPPPPRRRLFFNEFVSVCSFVTQVTLYCSSGTQGWLFVLPQTLSSLITWSLRRGHDKAAADSIWGLNSMFEENLPSR